MRVTSKRSASFSEQMQAPFTEPDDAFSEQSEASPRYSEPMLGVMVSGQSWKQGASASSKDVTPRRASEGVVVHAAVPSVGQSPLRAESEPPGLRDAKRLSCRDGSWARPWRKSRFECAVEAAQAQQILGAGGEAAEGIGVDAGALLFCLLAQELLEGQEDGQGEGGHLGGQPGELAGGQAGWAPLPAVASSAVQPRLAAQTSLDLLRQVATNNAAREEVEAAREMASEAMAAVGLGGALRLRLQGPPPGRHDTCHEVIPGLWLGGWVALNNDCADLRKRRVTHVVSVTSADKRKLPAFVRGHLHVRSDDREDAGPALGGHFPEICRFVDAARREPGGCVYMHCGAGISRAPTAAASYVMWKLGVPAAAALEIIKKKRPSIRPNLGFVRQLRSWESEMLSLPGCGCAVDAE